ncbi:MAG: ribonuclease HII [Bacteroidales bacterium]|jgi:ribonuclease HII|nr:ribonuclease HII [Bacteroidales bacterium]
MSLKNSYSGEDILECGCDEAGRGALAGPLFTAAVILPPRYKNDEINDSKQLSPTDRQRLRLVIERDAVCFAVVPVSEQVIDNINILNATFQGMNKAIMQLSPAPSLLLIDGNRFNNTTPYPYRCCIKGDATYLSIAAASILAKTYRDEWMEKLDREYPCYDWKKNKGYPTASHRQTLLQKGPSPYHRHSFHLKSQLKLDLFS